MLGRITKAEAFCAVSLVPESTADGLSATSQFQNSEALPGRLGSNSLLLNRMSPVLAQPWGNIKAVTKYTAFALTEVTQTLETKTSED